MSKVIVSNRKAFHDYFIEDKIEAGIELEGWEVKSARAGEVNLTDSFVYFQLPKKNTSQKQSGVGSVATNNNTATANIECWLKNAHFSPYKQGRVEEQIPRRDRKLLLRRSQIEKMHMAVKAKSYTCVVTKLYLNPRGLVKAEIALARGKQNYDKRQTLKDKDIKRDTEKQLKEKRRGD